MTRLAVLTGLLVCVWLGATALSRSQPGTPPPPRPRALYQTGFDLFKRGEYEKAEAYYAAALKGQDELTPREQQELKVAIDRNNLALQARQDGATRVRMAEQALREGRPVAANNLLKAADTLYLAPSDRQILVRLQDQLRTGGAGNPATANQGPPLPANAKADYKSLLSSARAALQRGDLDTAEALCMQAEKTAPRIVMFWSDNHSKLRRDIQTTRIRVSAAQPPSEKKEPFKFKGMFSRPKDNPEDKLRQVTDGPVLPPPPKDPEKGVKQESPSTLQSIKNVMTWPANLLPGARTEDKNDKNDKNPLVTQAGPNEQGPRLPPPAGQPDAKLASGDPRDLVRQARLLLAQNRLEEADAACKKAMSIPTKWGLFEDSPASVDASIQAARKRRDRDEAGRLLADARKLMAQGLYAEAKAKAQRAQQLHGPYSVWDFGDRPNSLIAEIDRAELKSKAGVGRDPAAHAKNTPPNAGLLSKQRAQALIAEARDLERQGKLVEARQKAIQAAQLNATFAPGEDTPQHVLAALASQGDRHIQALLQRVEINAAGSDPNRFYRAEADLTAARQLAQSFGLDAGRVEQKAAWLRNIQLSMGLTPPPSMGGHTLAEGKRQLGLEKLNRVRLEIKAGNTHIARPLAEELAADPSYGVQHEAFALIRSIAVEERNQQTLTADRTAQAAVDAFRQRNFRVAHNIMATIDLSLLNPQMQGVLREIGSTPEMVALASAAGQGPTRLNPTVIPAQGTNAGAPGHANAGDLGAHARTGDGFEQVKAMEEIQFQQLRLRGINAQNLARERTERGDVQGGIDTLNDYLAQVDAAQLAPEHTNLLRGSIHMRLQQLKTVKAQLDIAREQQSLAGAGHNEGIRNRAIQKNQEQVAELMKQYRMFHKEGKYKEALVAARQAHELDPDNVAAGAAIRILAIQEAQRDHDRIKATNEKGFLDALNNDRGPSLNISNPLHFDREIQQRADKRPNTANGIWMGSRSAAERIIEHKLNLPVSLNAKDASLKDVIEYLHLQSGLNIIPDVAALKEQSISLHHPMNLPSVENIPLKSALNILLKQVHLTYVIKDDVLQITTEEHARGKYKVVTYPVADLVIPVDNHPTPEVFDFKSAMQRHIDSQSNRYQGMTPYSGPFGLPNGQPVSSQGSGLHALQPSGYGAGNAPGSQSAGPRRPGQHMDDLLMALIQNTVAPTTWKDVGGQGTIQYFPLGMALVINQTQEVQEDVFALLQSLRRLQDLEVAIELKLVSVSESFFERLGLDFDITFLTNNKRYESQLLTGQFQPAGFINQFRPGRFVSGLTPAGTFTPDLNIPIRNSSFEFSVPPFGGYPGTLGADGGLTLGLAFLSDVQVFMLLEAAQGDKRASVMQAPKITVFNGQTATLTVADSVFFLLRVDLNVTGLGNMFFTPVNAPIPLGVTMSVTPVISADRRFVRLNMTPTLTNLASATVPLIPIQVPVPTFLYGPGVGSTAAPPETVFQMFFQQPSFTTIALDTTVNVPDGGTVLMGGLKTLFEARNEFGPPVLSKIPYINRLFRNIGYGREAQSLMIMVTPRIIIQEEERAIFEGEIAPIPRF